MTHLMIDGLYRTFKSLAFETAFLKYTIFVYFLHLKWFLRHFKLDFLHYFTSLIWIFIEFFKKWRYFYKLTHIDLTLFLKKADYILKNECWCQVNYFIDWDLVFLYDFVTLYNSLRILYFMIYQNSWTFQTFIFI